jgi:hypothetical protein
MQEERGDIIHGFTGLNEGSYENQKQRRRIFASTFETHISRGGMSVIVPLNDEFISKSTLYTPSQQILTLINLQFA